MSLEGAAGCHAWSRSALTSTVRITMSGAAIQVVVEKKKAHLKRSIMPASVQRPRRSLAQGAGMSILRLAEDSVEVSCQEEPRT
jgi:hypothetical protein